MQAAINRKALKRRVRYRIRKGLAGDAGRPRLAVFRSTKHIYVQAIDDSTGRTLACASSRDPEISSGGANGGNVAAATRVGEAIAAKLKEANVKTVVFDRGGFIYHGRVKALADAARAGGLKF